MRRVAAAACTLAALALLGLAFQVRSWQSHLRGDDLRFQVSPLERGLWRGPTGPGAALAARLLDVRDDVRFRRAEQQFVRVQVGASDYRAETRRLAAFGQAQSTFEELSRTDAVADRRARAGNLLGILLWENAQTGQDNGPLLVRQSLAAFRAAVRAAPEADDAKYNLELLSTLLQPDLRRRRDAPAVGGTGLRGAGLGTAGKGY